MQKMRAKIAMVLWMTFTMTATANATIGLNMQVFGPRGGSEFAATTLDPELATATRLGGHLGYLQTATGTTDPDPLSVPKAYPGPSWCVLSSPSPCAVGEIRVFGSVDGTNGNLQLFARAETPVADSFSSFISATLTDQITLPAQSSGLPIRLMLGGRHEQRVDQPLTSFPGSDFVYVLTLRRPDEASPPGCDQAPESPPCDVTFAEIFFSSSYDSLLGTTSWSWFATGFDVNGQQTIDESASGQGSGTSLQIVVPNPRQPMELTIDADALADCVNTEGGICQTRVDASSGAYVSFLGSYSSTNGYVYAPEPSGAAVWLSAAATLAGLSHRRRPS